MADKKDPSKKSPAKKAAAAKKTQGMSPSARSNYVRASGNKPLANLIDKQRMESQGRVYATKIKPSTAKPKIKSTGKLSGRAMRGGKRMTAGKLDGL